MFSRCVDLHARLLVCIFIYVSMYVSRYGVTVRNAVAYHLESVAWFVLLYRAFCCIKLFGMSCSPLFEN